MNTQILSSDRSVAIALVAVALFVSGGIFANAASIFDVEFPIPELGNCADRLECKAYCDDPANEEACHVFAAKYGLGEARAEVDDRIEEAIGDGGPGGCAENTNTPRASCEAYCSLSAHMRECVLYAKSHGLMEADELEEAEKVIAALDSGVPLPKECTDARSCKAVCENPSNVETMRSCFAFAERAGLLPPGVDREKAEKVFRAIEEGRSPFKNPRDFEQCENPQSDEVFQKCIDFATESGFLSSEEQELIKKTGGKGPGGCRGSEQCETYCEEHGEECFAFAEQHGILKEEDKRRMQEGIQQIRSSLDQAPSGVRECISEAIGGETLDQMLSGTRPPSRQIGGAMQKCFGEHFRSQTGQLGPPEGEGGFPFPGQGQDAEGGFPGQGPEGEFPGQGFGPPPHEGQGFGTPPQGFVPPSGTTGEFRGERGRLGPPAGFEGAPPEFQQRYQEESARQYNEQYQKQYQEEYQRQFEQQHQQYQQNYPGQTYPSDFEGGQPPPPQSEYQSPTSINVLSSQLAGSLAAFFGFFFGQ